jgi:hypothetical protein
MATVAVASSEKSANSPATNAVDRKLGTRWESVFMVDPQWIYVDFGAPVFMNRVQIAWEAACGASYDLQTSNDKAAWTTMKSITGNTSGGPAPTDWSTAADHQGFTGVGRYMRVYGKSRCLAPYGYSIWEMQVYGDTNASCLP